MTNITSCSCRSSGCCQAKYTTNWSNFELVSVTFIWKLFFHSEARAPPPPPPNKIWSQNNNKLAYIKNLHNNRFPPKKSRKKVRRQRQSQFYWLFSNRYVYSLPLISFSAWLFTFLSKPDTTLLYGFHNWLHVSHDHYSSTSPFPKLTLSGNSEQGDFWRSMGDMWRDRGIIAIVSGENNINKIGLPFMWPIKSFFLHLSNTTKSYVHFWQCTFPDVMDNACDTDKSLFWWSIAKHDIIIISIIRWHMKYGVWDHLFWNLIGCSPGSIFPYSDMSAFPCQSSLHIWCFVWVPYYKARINWLLGQC